MQDGALGSTQCVHMKARILPSNQGAENYSPSHSGAMGLPKSDTRTPNNLPSEQGLRKVSLLFRRLLYFLYVYMHHSTTATEALRSSSSKKTLLSSPKSVKMPLTALPPQKPLYTTSATQATVRCNQGPLEHSMSVQGYGSSLSSTPGFLEHSTSSQKKLGQSSCMVESQNNWPIVQGTIGSLPPHLEPTEHSPHDQGAEESSLVVSRDLSELLSTKLWISAQSTLGLSTYTQQSLQQSSSSHKILGTSESAQCTYKHLSSDLVSSGMSSQVPRTTGTLSHSPKPLGHSAPAQASPVSLPSLQKAVTTALNSQANLELNASLASAQGPLEYSSSAPGSQKTSAAPPGHVVPDDSPLDISISEELSSLFSSLSLLDHPLSTEGAFDLSKPTEGTLGPSTLCQGTIESLDSGQGLQQKEPSASDSSGSVQSSKGPMKISLSGQGTLESVSSALEPLAMSLTVQVSLGTLLSVQEVGG